MTLTAVAPTTKTPLPESPRRFRVALAGNPNCGKTSLFNALTGARQHVANYPGVTVEKRTGQCEIGGSPAEIVDLPGTYSLNSYSPEERVAERELASRPDVVVVVADSMQLQRNLVLLVQILQTGANPVLCLNMADEARAAGQRLDVAMMERLLGLPVVETEANTGRGVAELLAAIRRASLAPIARHRVVLGEDLEGAIAAVSEHLPEDGALMLSGEWTAVRLLLGDVELSRRVAEMPAGGEAVYEAQRQRARLEAVTGLEIPVFVAERTFGFVDGLLRETRTPPPRIDARALSDRLDDVVAHPILGLPIFGAVLYAIFWLTFTLGEAPMGWIESGAGWIGQSVSSLWPAGSDSLLRSLLVDGVIAGVGGVLVFLPNILLLFLGLAFLEDTGYMARAAFLTDRLMHRFGLHGKSFIPMMTGFGCTVPGIMATRTLENEKDRLATMLVLPLMSCGARLPIWMLLIPAFFPPSWRAPVLWLVYATGIGLALALALLLRRTLLRGEDAPFVMELPPYRLPTLRSVLIKMIGRAGLYLRKAGTTILAISILLWAAMSFPKPASHQIDARIAAGEVVVAVPGAAASNGGHVTLSAADVAARRATEDLEFSAAGRIGHLLAPVFSPLGFDWKIVTAMIGALAAKEVFVAQMGIVYSIGDADAGAEGLRALLARDYSPLVGLSLMLFLLISAPCMATIAVTRRESGRWRWALLQLFGLTVIAYLTSLGVYQLGRLVV
ncbi:MAG: ferrous iron transport protein B [Acidobacteria bacterium]|nr:ferrous iron transport protein B [Acidobacteriota bacterium]MCG3194029.1 Fe(2+) transporter FeoB [Thermoanaerobaculia bacterium]